MPPTNANDPLRTTDHQPQAVPPTAVTTDGASGSSVVNEVTGAYVPGQDAKPAGAAAKRGPGMISVPGYEIEGVLGTRILTGSWDSTAKVWDAATGQQLLSLNGHTAPVLSTAWSPDGRRIVTGSNDGTAQLWDAQAGQVVRIIKGHINPVVSVAWSPDGKSLLTGSHDSTVKVWDADTGWPVRSLEGHTSRVRGVAWGRDGKHLFAWDGRNKVLGWSVADGTRADAKGAPRPASGAARSPDGRLVAKGDGRRVAVLDLLRPAPSGAAWLLPDAAERQRYHTEQAARAEQQKQWFAAGFHLRRLLRDQPNAAVQTRLRRAERELSALPN